MKLNLSKFFYGIVMLILMVCFFWIIFGLYGSVILYGNHP